MHIERWGILLAVLVLAGCAASTPPPIEMRGDTADLRALAGGWHGTFRNHQTHRTGQIDFHMAANSDSAYGEVVMYMETPSRPVWERPSTQPVDASATTTPYQHVRFVQVRSGYVTGEMESMYEPRCKCWVVARFVGRLRGDAIEGTYSSRSENGAFETNGTWRVARSATDVKP